MKNSSKNSKIDLKIKRLDKMADYSQIHINTDCRHITSHRYRAEKDDMYHSKASS